MEYEIEAHETKYNGVNFRSRLEARWASFFDLIRKYQRTDEKWRGPTKPNGEIAYLEWEYKPIDLKNWVPDFLLKLPCTHSECPIYHKLYVEVKPYRSIEEFKGDPVWEYYQEKAYSVPNPAIFGINPDVTRWEMVHGAGGGREKLTHWVPSNYQTWWKKAGNIVQWKPDE